MTIIHLEIPDGTAHRLRKEAATNQTTLRSLILNLVKAEANRSKVSGPTRVIGKSDIQNAASPPLSSAPIYPGFPTYIEHPADTYRREKFDDWDKW